MKTKEYKLSAKTESQIANDLQVFFTDDKKYEGEGILSVQLIVPHSEQGPNDTTIVRDITVYGTFVKLGQSVATWKEVDEMKVPDTYKEGINWDLFLQGEIIPELKFESTVVECYIDGVATVGNIKTPSNSFGSPQVIKGEEKISLKY